MNYTIPIILCLSALPEHPFRKYFELFSCRARLIQLMRQSRLANGEYKYASQNLSRSCRRTRSDRCRCRPRFGWWSWWPRWRTRHARWRSLGWRSLGPWRALGPSSRPLLRIVVLCRRKLLADGVHRTRAASHLRLRPRALNSRQVSPPSDEGLGRWLRPSLADLPLNSRGATSNLSQRRPRSRPGIRDLPAPRRRRPNAPANLAVRRQRTGCSLP
jgi:hypothetical protein